MNGKKVKMLRKLAKVQDSKKQWAVNKETGQVVCVGARGNYQAYKKQYAEYSGK